MEREETLPILRDGAAQVHRGGRARPRALHPQHGDGRVNAALALLLVSAADGLTGRRGAMPSSSRLSALATSAVARDLGEPRRPPCGIGE